MKKMLTVLAALALLLCLAAPAEATFRLRIENTSTGTGVVISDNGGGDFDTQANSIVFVGAIDGFTVTVTTGLRTPLYQAPGYYDAIDLASVNVKGAGAGTLRIILEGDGFTGGPDGAIVLESRFGGTLTAPDGSSVTFLSGANAGNLIPTLGPDTNPSGPLGAVPDLPPAGSVTTSNTVNAAPNTATVLGGGSSVQFVKSGPYSLFSVATVNFTGAGSVSFDHQTGTNPAPAGVLLAAAAAPLLGAGAWLRRRKAAVTA